jgi:uncharacterized repeat protein (TIGR03803 family)
MKIHRRSCVGLVFLVVAAYCVAVRAQIYQELYSFSRPPDGVVPYGGLVEGNDGNFYGTTFYGGAYDYGAVFRITPSGALTIIASFNGTNNGRYPDRTLLLASDGDFYGLMWNGDAFRVSTNGILTFLGSPLNPKGELIQADDGFIYDVLGADNHGNNYGYIYRTSLYWKNSQLMHTFTLGRAAADGIYPEGGLIQATDGNFYGTTSDGGAYGYGVVYRITSNGTYTAMCSFNRGPGAPGAAYPYGRLLQASDGNFYGVAGTGEGTIFRMTPNGALTTIAWFDCYAGEYPNGGLIEANDGCFYGTSPYCGTNIGASGTVFRMTRDGTLTGLFSFTGNTGPYPGSNPYAGLVQGSDGNLYGTSGGLGTRGSGNVFRIIMPGPRLTATASRRHLVLSWRTNYTGFKLQCAQNSTSANWVDITNSPTVSGGQFWMTNPMSGAARFFRLKK